MPKKILDIIPPEDISALPDVVFQQEQKKEGFAEQIHKRQIDSKKPAFPKWIILCLIFVVGGALFLHTVLAKVDVVIWPNASSVKFKEIVNADPSVLAVDLSKKIIPGVVLETEGELTKEFFSSGKKLKGEKAQGTIRVSNNYSSAPQVLIVNTRFISDGGKLFRSKNKIIVPGQFSDNGKKQTGFIDVPVEAAEAGEDYNIGPATFSIPGFAGTPKYTAFYGKTSLPMVGGFKGEVAVVSSDDLDKAVKNLGNTLKEELKKSLLTKTSSDFILLENGIYQEIISQKFSAKAEDEAKSFNTTARMKVKAMVLKKSDMEQFVVEYLNTQIPEGRKVYKDSLKIQPFLEQTDSKANKLVIAIEFEATIFDSFNEDSLKQSLLGKNLNDAKTFLTSQTQIRKADIKASPFWLRNIPSSPNKVDIKLNIFPSQ